MNSLRVLLCGYEMLPFFKKGGLGDVMGSLPKALDIIGVEAKAVIPYYQDIRSKENLKRIGQFFIHFGSGEEEVGVYKTNLPNSKVEVYFLSNRPNLSYINTRGKNKKIDQFAFFDLAVSHFISYLSYNEKWLPSVIHCNDWQTSLIPLILKKKTSLNIPTLLTIHNHNYQGIGSLKVLDLLHIKDEDTKEIKRGKPVKEINILGEGIIHATKVSTVSPTYAKEITQNHMSGQLKYFLEKRALEKGERDEILGILNGIDHTVWNPTLDNQIFHKYDLSTLDEGKRNNKEDLIRTLSLQNKPTFAFIGRMVKQKGVDLLIKAIKKLNNNINFIFLGTGDPNIEKSITRVITKSTVSNIKAIFDYDEDFAHKLYVSSDFVIIPSHFEPCGLVQMVAMKYGTIPIASETGGLKDSIIHNKNGILFKKNSASSLFGAIKHALLLYNNQSKFRKMQVLAMKTDFSWDKSAKLYKNLYTSLVQS